MSQAFSQYIKIIGKGKKGSRSLTEEEAFTSMSMLLNNEITGDQRGAFLMLLRTREETPQEITGFVKACRRHLPPDLGNLRATVDIGCYAGKRRQLPWYLLAVACLAQQGERVFLHGAHEPGSGRLYASQVLPALGLNEVDSFTEAQQQIEKTGATYLDLGRILPSLNMLIKLREVFGLRSCANTLARLLNPAGAPFCVQGVFHTHLDHKHAQVNAQFPHYDSLCFRGDAGEPEVNSERVTELFLTREGHTKMVVLPESAAGWATKDKELDVNTMLGYWHGEIRHRYAGQAIHATLTSLIMLIYRLPLAEAKEKAHLYWQQRAGHQLPFKRA